ncbi:MAG: LCP family protein [Clostridiales bacterium]|nr:LCP family protein [Clostridiales bacterium]
MKIAIGSVLGITAIALGTAAYLKLGGSPPPIRADTPITPAVIVVPGDDPTPAPNAPEVPVEGSRDPNKYTFLVLGADDGNGNTDVIMVATLDVKEYTLNVVSIPRDTLVNVAWTPRLANSIYYGMRKSGTDEDPQAGLREKFAEILGYPVDFYVLVDLDAFVTIVDAVGGIHFDVPQKMQYSDPAQNLYIDIQKGPQTLMGKKALELVRFRTYSNADIGRIDMTQQFLTAAVRQILENKSSINPLTIAKIALGDVKTDLTLDQTVWFVKELLKFNADDVTFDIVPGNYNDHVGGKSYVTIYVDEWLEKLNEKLNPFTVPITIENLSIYTRNSSGTLYTTNGVYASGNGNWGNGGTSSGGGTSSTPAPTATPTPSETDNAADPPDITDNPIVTDDPAPPDITTTPEIPDIPDIPDPTPEMTPPPATPPEDEGALFYTGTI